MASSFGFEDYSLGSGFGGLGLGEVGPQEQTFLLIGALWSEISQLGDGAGLMAKKGHTGLPRYSIRRYIRL